MSEAAIAQYVMDNLRIVEVDLETRINTYSNRDNSSLFKYRAKTASQTMVFHERKLTDPAYLSYRSARISKCCEQCCYDFWTNYEPSKFHDWSHCFQSQGCSAVCCIHSQVGECPLSVAADYALEKVKCPSDNQFFSSCRYNSQVCTACSSCPLNTVQNVRGIYPPCFDTMNTLCSPNCVFGQCPTGKYETSRTANNCVFCSECSASCSVSSFFVCGNCSSTSDTQCCPCSLCPQNTFEIKACSLSADTVCQRCPGNFITQTQNTKSIGGCVCPPGSWRSATCMLCPAGNYSDTFDATYCKQCPEGFFSEIGVSSCSPIPTLSYKNTSLNLIIYNFENVKYEDKGYIWNQYTCPTSYFKQENTANMTSGRILYQVLCQSCNEKTVNCTDSQCYGIIANNTCMPCPKNQVAIKTNSVQCQCSQGFSGPACDACPEGFFSNTVGASNCTQCPLGTFSSKGSMVCSTLPIIINSTRIALSEVEYQYTNIKLQEKRFVWEMTSCENSSFYKRKSRTVSLGYNNMISFTVICTECKKSTCVSEECQGCAECPYPTVHDPTTLQCVCRENFFVNSANPCRPCPNGMYTTQKNAAECLVCPKGKTSSSGSPCRNLAVSPLAVITSDIKMYEFEPLADDSRDYILQSYDCEEGFYKQISTFLTDNKRSESYVWGSGNITSILYDGTSKLIFKLYCRRCKYTDCVPPQYVHCTGKTTAPICKNCTANNRIVTIQQDLLGETACQYSCPRYWIMDGNSCINMCVDTASLYQSDICIQPGFYTHAPCLLNATNQSVQCKQCTNLKSNEVYTSSGSAPNDPSSCNVACMPKHYRGPQGCMPWTTDLQCPLNHTRIEPTPLQDTSCIPCSTAITLPKSGAMRFLPNTCIFYCIEGYQFLDGECTPCAAGTFKMKEGNIQCEACPSNYYAPRYGSSSCDPVPKNAKSNPTRTGYECSDYFTSSSADDPMYQSECAPCSSNISNAIYYEFSTKCVLQKIGCSNGYYAVADDSGLFQCVPCPAALPSNMSIDSEAMQEMLKTDKFYHIKLNQVCGSLQGICTTDDKINIACFQHVKCNTGFYLEQAPSFPTKLSNSSSCVPCANAACSVGAYEQKCVRPSKVNYCSSCPMLSEGFIYTSGCTSTCDKGYTGTSSCVKCDIGKIKSVNGTGQCTYCPSQGMYTYLAGATSCQLCESGKYSSAQGATVCAACPQGKFSNISGSSNCTDCAESTIAAQSGSTSCSACPTNSLYTYAPVGSSYCVIPQANCPQGLFLPSSPFFQEFSKYLLNSTRIQCEPCMEGTYCPGDLQMYVCNYNKMSPQYSPSYSKSNSSCSYFQNPTPYTSTITKSTPCPENTSTFSRVGADSVFACHPKRGYYGLPGKPAKPCPRDHYCLSMNHLPIGCPSQAPWSEAMSYDLSNCSTTMFPPCRRGYFLGFNPTDPSRNNSVCSACLQGYYCPGDSVMYHCGTNTYQSFWFSDPISFSVANCSNKNGVESGHALDQCPSNSNMPTIPIGSTGFFFSILQCEASPGYLFVPKYHAQSMKCPIGFYCPNRTIYPVKCISVNTCPVGKSINSNRCPNEGMASPLAECNLCDTLPSFATWSEPSTCNFCCNTGYFRSSDRACSVLESTSNCQEGYYRQEVPANSSCRNTVLMCQKCTYPLDTTRYIQGSTEYTMYSNFHTPLTTTERNALISAGYIREYGQDACHWKCNPGSFYDPATRICRACPEGTFSQTVAFNRTACANCPRGTYSSTMGATQCRSCGTWNVAQASLCLTCRTYSAKTGKCIACQTWSSSPQTNCTCMAGTYLTSQIKTMEYDSRYYIHYACKQCPSGTISKQGATECSTCEPGTVCSLNSALEEPCSVGWFKNTNKSTCLPCPTGTFSNVSLAYATTCTPCETGTFNPYLNASTCLKCANGSYTDTRSSSQCQSCVDPIMITPETRTECLCPLHWFWNQALCSECKLKSCHKNATLTPCLQGSKKDTSSCKCNAGFTGDGLSCSSCTDANTCVCAVGERHLWVEIN